ncbi:MAG: hypothetical protein N2314_06070 [Brevinematales bacterium]|nr:hypothetical protein [Brevinematales bacterium]
MKRVVLALSMVFLFLLSLVVGGVVYLYLQWPAEKVLRMVNDSLERTYRLRVEISSAHIDWLKGVTLLSPRLVEKGGKVLLEAKEISAYYDIFALLQKTVKFSRLTIRGLYTTSEDIQKVVTRFQPLSSSSKKAEGFDFVIQQMVFVDSQVVYNAIPVSVDVTWNLGSFTTPGSYEGLLVSMYGKVSFHGRGKNIRFQVEDMEVGRFWPETKEIVVKKLGGELYLQGNQWLVKGSTLSLLWQSNQVTSSRYQLLYDVKRSTFLLSDTSLKYNTSDIQISNFFYDSRQKLAYGVAEDFSINVKDFVPGGEGTCGGKVTFRYENGSLSQLDGSIYLKGVAYGPLQIEGDFRVLGFSLEGEASLRLGKNTMVLRSSPIGRQGLALVMSAETFDLSDVFRQKWPKPAQKAQERSSPRETKTFSLGDLLEVFPLDIEVNLPRVVYEDLVIEDVYMHLVPRGKAWVMEQVGGRLLRGSIRGNAIIAGDFLRGTLQLTDIKLHDLNGVMLKDGKTVYGTLKGAIEYQLPLTNILMGYVGFGVTVEKPEFRGLVLQNQISEVLYNLPLERLSFDVLTLNGEMREGKIFMKDARLDSYDIQGLAQAVFYLEKKIVDTSLTLSVSKEYISGLPNVTQLLTAGYSEGNRLVFRLKVTNTWEKPKVVLLPAGK